MEYRDIFAFETKWNVKTISFFAFLTVLPNLFGLINISTPFGFKIHTFQVVIFLAAAIYGPIGGLVSGGFGSIYSAIIMNNPYIVVGNMILGLFAGIFFRKGFNLIIAALLAFAIQLPWLFFTDLYLVKMPIIVVSGLIVALFISHIVWAGLVQLIYKPVKKLVN
jgi:uncharacterized membrane protein